MSPNRRTDHQADADWPAYTTTAASTRAEPIEPTSGREHAGHEQSGHAGHGGMHKWMMLLMCLPLVAVGVWTLATGGGARGLIGGLMCMGMMAVMHFAMGGMGKGHRH